jgi:hypothetical protein
VRPAGNHLPQVTYVVSESFVVATKRVKHAIKSDIPSIGDHISKLVHIGKATVDKLQVWVDWGGAGVGWGGGFGDLWGMLHIGKALVDKLQV